MDGVGSDSRFGERVGLEEGLIEGFELLYSRESHSLELFFRRLEVDR
jgi:hypothetical protein